MSSTNIINKVFLFLILISFNITTYAHENIFYVLRSNSSDRMSPATYTYDHLQKYYKKIDILIPQAYYIKDKGIVGGKIEARILDFGIQHKMKIMPLVTNSFSNTKNAHRFLSDQQAQTKAINSLIDICKKNYFIGMQIDFEMIRIEDRDLLTKFYQLVAEQFHQQNLLISFAVAPIVTDKPNSIFLKRLYANWEGAYDLKKIGKVANFISIMAYNQHGTGLTPGPTASLPWVEQVVRYALNLVPADKVSLGIGDFTTYWYTGNSKEKIHVKMRAMDYGTAMRIVNKYKPKVIWDDQLSVYYAIFLKNWLNEYLFFAEVRSFEKQYQLVNKYKLRGISVFDLGTEDEKIWDLLSN